MTTAIAEYNQTELALSDLRGKYTAIVFDVSTGKGMAEAKAARAELRTYRVNLEKMRVDIKAPALERCRLIDTEAKRITAELVAMEEPIDETIKAEEQRKEREKAAREQADREKTEARNRAFDEVKGLPLLAVDATAVQIEALIVDAQARDLSMFEAEYQDAAKFALDISVLSLKAALDKRRAADAAAEKVRKDLEELEVLRANQERMRQEADRLAAAERERVAAEERRVEEQARSEREAIESAQRKAREEEQARIDAERAAQRRKEDAEREKAAQDLREAQAKQAAERKRLDDDKKAAAKAARASEIANATLLTAASDAVAFLTEKGFGDDLVTQKLAAALRREPAKKAA